MITLRSLMRLGQAMQLPKVTVTHSLLYTPVCGMAFMQLFERNKTPAELDHSFKRVTKLKGHLKSKAIKNHSKKLNMNTRVAKQKLKNHKGLLKRIKIVGPRWNRRFKFQSPGANHLRSNKSRANLLRKRRTRYVHVADIRKVKKLIPYYKRRSLKIRY